jgi:hypothetical protein
MKNFKFTTSCSKGVLAVLLATGCPQTTQHEPLSTSGDGSIERTPIEEIVLSEVGNPLQERLVTDSRKYVISESIRSQLIELALENHQLIVESNESALNFNRHPTIDRIVVAEPSILPRVDKTDDRMLARIVLFDYRRGLGSEIIAQVFEEDRIEILSHSRLDSSGVPVTSEEKISAQELLSREIPAYRELLGGISPESYDLGFFHANSTNPHAERLGHRVFLVRPVYFEQSIDVPITIVDLSTDEIVSIEE